MRSLPSAALVSFLCLAGCSTAARRPVGKPVPVASTRGVDARYMPSFEALGRAVAADDDGLARQVHDRLEARLLLESEAGLEEADEALTILDAYGRILGGRERMASLGFELIGRPDVGSGKLRIGLRVASSWPGELLWNPGPATVSQRMLVVSPNGRETWRTSTSSTPALEDLVLLPGSELEVTVLELPLMHPQNAIAVRRTLVLELRAGDVAEAEILYPSTSPLIDPLDWSRPAPWLPEAAVEPAELLRYVVETERPGLRPANPASIAEYEERRAFFTAALLERAVRIDSARREEALDLLAPYVARSSVDEVERIAPALRWLTARSGEANLAGDLWKEWFAQRGEMPVDSAPAGGLDLPRRPVRD